MSDWLCKGCGKKYYPWHKECRKCNKLQKRRLAFLSAWHPRAGNPLMIKYINKDIARLIAEKYIIHEKPQSLEEYLEWLDSEHEKGNYHFTDI